MPDEIKGLLFTEDEVLEKNLSSQTESFVDFSVCKFSYDEDILRLVSDNNISVVFIDIQDKNGIDKKLDTANLISSIYPDIKVFVIGQGKDPLIILKCLRAGVADYIDISDSENNIFLHAFKKLDKCGFLGKKGKVFSLFSMKGGLGVTTVAANLADQIYKLSQAKVVLLDLNLYMGNVSHFFDMDIKYTPFNLLKDIDRLDDNLLFSSMEKHERGFYILGVSREIADADQIKNDDIKKLIEIVRLYADYIIIDMPHNFSERILAAMELSDRIIVLLQQDVQSIKGAQKTMDIFSELGFDDNKIMLAVNRFNKKNDILIRDISDVFAKTPFFCINNDFKLFSAAADVGMTLDRFNPNSKSNRQIAIMASEVSGMKMRNSKKWSLSNLLNWRNSIVTGRNADESQRTSEVAHSPVSQNRQ